jgi:hypothetical protein
MVLGGATTRFRLFKGGTLGSMDNEQFNDVGILNVLANLQRSGMLHEDDRRELADRLSPWGKARVEDFLKAQDVSIAARVHKP